MRVTLRERITQRERVRESETQNRS